MDPHDVSVSTSTPSDRLWLTHMTKPRLRREACDAGATTELVLIPGLISFRESLHSLLKTSTRHIDLFSFLISRFSDGSYYYFNADYSQCKIFILLSPHISHLELYRSDLHFNLDFDDKQGHSIYIAPDGIKGWTRLDSLDSTLGPRTAFSTAQEREAALVSTVIAIRSQHTNCGFSLFITV